MAADVKKKIEKIDFILAPSTQNSQLADLSRQLSQGLELEGVKTRILTSPKDKKPEAFIDDLIKNAPDLTVSFNGILPDNQGYCLADLIKIPHLAILTDPPSVYLELAKSPYTIITCLDAFFTEFFKRAGAQRTLFIPFSAPIETPKTAKSADRSIDLLMIPQLIDPDAIVKSWKADLPKGMCDLLQRAKGVALHDPSKGYYPAFLEEFNQLNQTEREELKSYHSIPLLYQYEMFLRGVDQLELMSSLKGNTVDLLIPKGTKDKWEKLLRGMETEFRFHERDSLGSISQTLKDTKILLHSSPHIREGTDGMVYTALLYGAYAISSETPFLANEFTEKEGVWFYPYREEEAIRLKVNQLIDDPALLDSSVEKGRTLVNKSHTWKNYASELLKKLPPLLSDLPYGLQSSAEKKS